MITLKEYLSQKFNSSILIISIISWVLISLCLIGWGIFSAKNTLKQELVESSITVTALIYDKNWGLINEHFNSEGRVGFYSYVKAKSKQDSSDLYEARFNEFWFLPEICGSNNSSELVNISACTKIVRPDVLIFVTMAMLIYAIALFYLFKLIQEKILISLDGLAKEISNSLDDDPLSQSSGGFKIKDIENIKVLIESKKNVLKKISQEAAFIRLSQKVTHDLRSPLSVILNLSSKDNLDLTDKANLKASANNLKEIANNLLNASLKDNKLPRVSRVHLSQSIKRIIKLKEEELPHLCIENTLELKVLYEASVWLNLGEFNRALSNIINNSLEACELPTILIEVLYENGVIIRIRDNGPGFPDSILESYCSTEFKSTKLTGFGIGLNSAKTSVDKMGGIMKIFNQNGACVEITFPESLFVLSNTPIVLIDDDKYIRQSWISLAKQNQLMLLVFSSYDEFLLSVDSIDKNAEIYIDSNLGNNVRGDYLIEKILNLGFKIVNIQTGYDETNIQITNGLNNVVSKEFPYRL